LDARFGAVFGFVFAGLFAAAATACFFIPTPLLFLIAPCATSIVNDTGVR
jgi:hypothetical protein